MSAESLRAQQFALAAHIRDPRLPPPPSIEDRRLAIYRDLFINNIDALLAGNFPVIRKLFDDHAWKALVRDFYRDHRSTTPLFPEVPREFIAYVQARAAERRGDPAWLPELAHYEWVELALEISEASLHPQGCDAHGDLLDGTLLLSPLAWPLAYAWPVHRLAPDFLPEVMPLQPTFLLVFRDATHAVRFREISALTFRMLQRLGEQSAFSGRSLLDALADEAGIDHDPQTRAFFIANGAQMLATLRDERIIVATAR